MDADDSPDWGTRKTLYFTVGPFSNDLSASDFETHLLQLKQSTVLENIVFRAAEELEEYDDDPHLSILGRHFADVLKSVESVTDISFQPGLSRKFVAELIVGLSDYALPSLTCIGVFMFIEDSATALHIASLIRRAPQLRRLLVDGICTLSEDAVDAWSQALIGAESLEVVIIGIRADTVTGDGVLRAVAEGFSASCRKNVVERLLLRGEIEGLVLILPLLVTANIAELTLGQNSLSYLGPDGWLKVGVALRQVKALRRLIIYVSGFNEREKDCLRILWESSGRSSLISLSLDFEFYDGNNSAEHRLTEILKFTVPTEVRLGDDSSSLGVASLFSSGDCTVKTLNFRGSRNACLKGWCTSLRKNTSITKLDFRYCSKLGGDDFKELMDLLQVNFSLRDIDLEGTPWMNDGKAALVKEALERNSKQSSYFTVMREAKFSFDEAKAGRIFLCGSPFAGKTRLKMTMLEMTTKRNMFDRVVNRWKRLTDTELSRTKGIEVDWLGREDGKKVSMWDLGGQYIFRALEELLFPKISKVCAFIFVYSPFCRKGKRRVPRDDPVAAFEEDLKQWLRFIVSNIQVTGNLLPRVFVTITHKDHIQSAEYNLRFVLDDYVEVVMRLRSRFEGVVDLYLSPDSEIHYVNGKEEADVKPVMDSVLQWMDHLMEKKTPSVPSICSNLMSQLAERCPDVLISPVQKDSSFYQYCSEASVYLKRFSPADDQGRKVLHAVASFMHDAGSIIMVPSVSVGKEDLVAVDPDWLTRSFLGELIGQGHGFRSDKEKLWSLPPVLQDGTASKHYLKSLLNYICSAKGNKGKKLDSDDLLELLQGLDLCYTVASDGEQPMYFMPLIVGRVEKQPEEVNGHVLAWGPSSSVIGDSGHEFFGFRMQCSDRERTCLSSVLYPRFQIHLRQALVKSLGEHHHTFRFARDYLRVGADGHQIIVENDGMEGDHVDFLVRCSTHKSREVAKQFVRKHFMDEFSSFCASPKGCQGVQLVVAILRPDIVRELIPQKFRGKAVPVVELKQRFESYAMELLQEGGDERAAFSYEHQWPSIPEARLPPRPELAKDLLQEKDIQEVKAVIHKEHLQNRLKLKKLQFISEKLADDESPDNRGAITQILQAIPSFKSTVSVGCSSTSSFTHSPDESKSKESVEAAKDTPAALDGVQRLEVTMKEEFSYLHHRLDVDFQQLRAELRDFKPILDDIKNTVTTVMSQINRMFSYTKSMQKHKIPCRPYFTLEDVSTVQRVNAFMHGGKAVCLHFMCESKQGHHLVEKQPGVTIQVEKNGAINKCLRKISAISVQLLLIAAEVGVQLTTGMGSVVPRFFNLVTNSVVPVKNLISVPHGSELDAYDPKSLEEAWWYLRDYLRDVAHVPLDKYSEEFRLHPVTYKDTADSFAWLCDKCTKSGKESSLLE